MIRSARWRSRLPNAESWCRRAARTAFDRAVEQENLRRALQGKTSEIGIVLASDAFVAKLNRDYRGKRGPTNVLSFAADSLEKTVQEAGETIPVGDVVIAFETAAAEARESAKPLAHHLAHLTVHGVLHLLGFDHQRNKDAARMESLEAEILEKLGVPDPYRAKEAAEVA